MRGTRYGPPQPPWRGGRTGGDPRWEGPMALFLPPCCPPTGGTWGTPCPMRSVGHSPTPPGCDASLAQSMLDDCRGLMGSRFEDSDLALEGIPGARRNARPPVIPRTGRTRDPHDDLLGVRRLEFTLPPAFSASSPLLSPRCSLRGCFARGTAGDPLSFAQRWALPSRPAVPARRKAFLKQI